MIKVSSVSEVPYGHRGLRSQTSVGKEEDSSRRKPDPSGNREPMCKAQLVRVSGKKHEDKVLSGMSCESPFGNLPQSSHPDQAGNGITVPIFPHAEAIIPAQAPARVLPFPQNTLPGKSTKAFSGRRLHKPLRAEVRPCRCRTP
jgi:hypothetical protein